MSRKFLNGLDLASQKITNLLAGTSAADAVCQAQVVVPIAQFSQAGALTATVTGTLRVPIIGTWVIVGSIATSATAPTGATLISDVKKNGTTIYSTTGNRPTIAISGTMSATTLATPDVTSLASGDYLTADISQVGSTVKGGDWVLVVYAYRTA